MTPVWVALAGGLGAGARYAVGQWVAPRTSDRMPWATLLINISGSFALGLLVGLGQDDLWTTILGTGFLGGYTTFSTASVETVNMALDRRYAAAATSALTMAVVSVAAATGGYALGTA